MDAANVLVVTVEPPKPGDQIQVLRKEYSPPKTGADRDVNKGVLSGHVFVRRPGGTYQASPDEIQMLQRRLLSGSTARPGHGSAGVFQVPTARLVPVYRRVTLSRMTRATMAMNPPATRRAKRNRAGPSDPPMAPTVAGSGLRS